MGMTKVVDVIAKLQEKNKNPRKVCNNGEINEIVKALLEDGEYIAENTKIKKGEWLTEGVQLSAEFKKEVAALLKQLGLNGQEAAAALENFTISKKFAEVISKTASHANHLYMHKVGKGVRFWGVSDVDQTIFARKISEKVRETPVPNTKGADGKPEKKKYKYAEHTKLVTRTTINPTMRELLQ